MAGQVGRPLGSRGGAIASINVTPLVDVCLVLLVILMVSSTYIVARSLKVKLPGSASSDGAAAAPTRVVIDKDGALRWNDHPVTEAALRGELAVVAARDRLTTIVISADKAALHGVVVHVMDLARRDGLSQFAIQVAPEP